MSWYLSITPSSVSSAGYRKCPDFSSLPLLTTGGSERGWCKGGGPRSLINDWFVLVRLCHSSSKLDSMQILG